MNEYKPLVSIIIPNYNHAMYLGNSIESALNQTYPNIEIVINDNNSSDDSISTAMKYIKYGVKICKNPQNIYNFNYDVLFDYVKGEYFVLLCADDIIRPDFVERAVKIMEAFPNIGFVHGERDYIDEKGNITELDPFFNCSFRVEGDEMLPIFMLTDIGQSAQAVIRTKTFLEVGKHETESDHLNIDREQWFRLAMISDYAYIQEKMAYIRMPEGTSETSRIVETFYHPIALYHTVKSFEQWGKIKNNPKILERVDKALKRFANECMGFTKVFLAQGKFDLAKKYLLFMRLVDKDIIENDEYIQCIDACKRRKIEKPEIEEFKQSPNYVFRKRNYEAPEHYVRMEDSKDVG